MCCKKAVNVVVQYCSKLSINQSKNSDAIKNLIKNTECNTIFGI